jgi:hypothetical protein
VYGYSGSGTGVDGETSTGTAGLFIGSVIVQGNFTVVGGAKSAAVPHPDGSLRRLYALESPESYFEDFGEGQVTNGRGTVPLDRDFAAVVQADRYLVFLTPRGNSKGLYVSSRTATGFEVREQQDGTATVAFDYRVVAKRKDIAGPRLERVARPSVELQVPPPLRPIPVQAPPPPPRLSDPAQHPTSQPPERAPRPAP